jgi:hypothetical protein
VHECGILPNPVARINKRPINASMKLAIIWIQSISLAIFEKVVTNRLRQSFSFFPIVIMSFNFEI